MFSKFVQQVKVLLLYQIISIVATDNTSSMPTSYQQYYFGAYNSGCGKREAHINWSVVTCQGITRYRNYLEDYYWSSAADSR